jgi:menaquinone-9 beta-reductase
MIVAPGIAAEQAARRHWDAVIVGAGPAGALAAIGLARRGLAVLLADRAEFPRWKVCGCCLNGAALAALDAAGLGTLAVDCGARPLEGILLAARGRTAALALGRGVVLSREAFDAALVRAAVVAGAAFLPGTAVTLGELSDNARSFFLNSGGSTVSCQASVVVAADGLGGRLLARGDPDAARPATGARVGAGVVVDIAPAFYQPGTVYMACGQGGYVGLVRLEDGRLDVAAALDVEQVRGGHGPGPSVVRILGETEWPVPPGLEDLNWKGTLPLTRQAKHLATGRVFAIGDAAGYIEPFTGEGIARALTAGLAVAPIAARAARRWDEALARVWTATYGRVIRRRQLTCRMAAYVLRHPRLARALIGLLEHAPALAAPVVRRLNRPLSLTPGPS